MIIKPYIWVKISAAWLTIYKTKRGCCIKEEISEMQQSLSFSVNLALFFLYLEEKENFTRGEVTPLLFYDTRRSLKIGNCPAARDFCDRQGIVPQEYTHIARKNSVVYREKIILGILTIFKLRLIYIPDYCICRYKVAGQ